MRGSRGLTLEQRWSAKVDRSGECWVWTGAFDGHGYGHIYDSASRKAVPAHRVSFTLFVGPIPAGQEIMHACDNPPCVNPAHLSLGTHADNMADAKAKGRLRVLALVAGTNHPRHALSAESVEHIRRTYRRGGARALAQRFGVAPSTVVRAARGRTYPAHRAAAARQELLALGPKGGSDAA